MRSILDLPRVYKKLAPAAKRRFDSIFSFSLDTGRLVVPKTMKPWVKQQFGSVKKVESQPILKITNMLTFEGALFNKLRADRPMHSTKSVTQAELLQTAKKEPFKDVEAMTPEDTFGRVYGRSEVSASNVAKYDSQHGLVIFTNPDPLAFTEHETIDHFEAALSWIAAAYKEEREAKFPVIAWNCLWKAGASLVHGHMQVLLTKHAHYASLLQMKQVDGEYKKRQKKEYFTELYNVHKALGLGGEKKSVRVFAHLTPKKEKEIVMLSHSADTRLFSTIHKVLKMLTTKLGVESFNVAVMLPPLDKSWKGFPVITRIIDRGALNAKTTDVAVMELLLNQSVISSDPVKVWKAVKKGL